MSFTSGRSDFEQTHINTFLSFPEYMPVPWREVQPRSRSWMMESAMSSMESEKIMHIFAFFPVSTTRSVRRPIINIETRA